MSGSLTLADLVFKYFTHEPVKPWGLSKVEKKMSIKGYKLATDLAECEVKQEQCEDALSKVQKERDLCFSHGEDGKSDTVVQDMKRELDTLRASVEHYKAETAKWYGAYSKAEQRQLSRMSR